VASRWERNFLKSDASTVVTDEPYTG